MKVHPAILSATRRNTPIVHFHVHNEYSFLDGVGTSQHLAARAREIGSKALGISNHGNLSGVLHHVKACEEAGIRPILGIEAYFRVDRLHHEEANRKYFHLLLIAQDMEGFRNLMRMSSESFESGFYHKPCLDQELLQLHSEGLIASTSCLSGFVPHHIAVGDAAAVKHGWDFLQLTFGDRLFAEIQPHDIDQLREVNIEIVNEATRRGVPIVATADAHYPWKDWADTQDVLLMARTGQTVATRDKAIEQGEDYMSFSGDTFYLMDGREMRSAFAKHHPHLPSYIVDEAIGNTVTVASWVKPFEFSKAMKVPKASDSPEQALELLRKWCEEGLFRIGRTLDPVYRKQMDFELEVLRDKGVLDYFLVIGDMVRWAKDQGIRVGPGRGSAAGSLVSYLCRITSIDPIGHGFLFERFLNPAREDMPDIDIDFQHDRRKEVIEYLRQKYGADRVANVAAFQTYGMASAIQACGKALGVPYDVIMGVTKTFDVARNQAGNPEEEEGEHTLFDLYDVCAPLRDLARDYPELWKHATRIEKQVKAMGKHPAGVVITDVPISEHMPTMRSSGGEHVTAWSERANFPIITEYGFLKIDALSTDSLTIQAMTAKLIERRTGKQIDFESIEQWPCIEDPDAVDDAVIGAFGEGRNLGIFQFGSHGISGLLKDIKPTTLRDVIAANALYRPGPLDGGVAFQYGARKNGREQWQHFHPSVAPFLDETYGLIIYQEQVIQIVQTIGGLSAGEADFVRKAMTKWHSNKTNTRRGLDRMTQFYEKCVVYALKERGMSKTEFDAVWNKVLQFSKYGFNKPHAGSYGLQGYQDQWLKHYYPYEFYTAVLTVEKGQIPRFVREALQRKVKILPPDVNVSNIGFSLEPEGIRFGLDSIKNVGPAVVKCIMDARVAGKFTDFDDFETRVPKRGCNKRHKECLVAAGAFDGFGMRSHIDIAERGAAEKVLLGFALSTAQQASKDDKLIAERVHTPGEMEAMEPGDLAVVGGEVVAIKQLTTKKGDEMAFVELAHGAEQYRVTFFPRQFGRTNGALESGRVLLVRGKLDGDRRTVLADDWCTIEQLKEGLANG